MSIATKFAAIITCLVVLEGCSDPDHQFSVGDLVRTKIGGLRGQVLRVMCDVVHETRCVYLVRFPVASMEAQYMREYEIERAATNTK